MEEDRGEMEWRDGQSDGLYQYAVQCVHVHSEEKKKKKKKQKSKGKK